MSLAQRPGLRIRTYHELALQAFEDMPTPSRVTVTAEQWEREWVTWLEGSFVALAGDELIGWAGSSATTIGPTGPRTRSRRFGATGAGEA